MNTTMDGQRWKATRASGSARVAWKMAMASPKCGCSAVSGWCRVPKRTQPPLTSHSARTLEPSSLANVCIASSARRRTVNGIEA
jgi:hypothetical protein